MTFGMLLGTGEGCGNVNRMLGFGFKKTKVLASAEKNVKQGRLSNAIADYERIAQEDPSDLNVLNTIGDLYGRVGNVEKATAYFKRVGDAYAAEGFTVKAIAVYKKLTKLNPTAFEVVLKLAELYSLQGLNNDARAQYMAVADSFFHKGDRAAAAAVLQKILDLDPNHPQTQTRLAQVYVQLGKKTEARDVYFRSAQALRARGALEACDAALGRVLELSPAFCPAILLRGEIRMEEGDARGAVEALESLPEIDSRPECLRMLLRAQLQLGQTAEAEPLARKLLTVFNDVSGVTLYTEALIAAGDFERALRFYQEHAVTLLTGNTPAVLQTLNTLIAPLKTNSRGLAILCELFEKADDTPHVAEVTESLAHLSVQEGALPKARDLYKKLIDMEPENPLHLQNYRQILARLGEEPAVRERGWQEGTQVLLSEERESPGPALDQNYSAELSVAVKDALTDSELFASYNLPARAIQPLEAILPRAPRHVKLNQRLASLYLRMDRLEETAQRCRVLTSVFAEAGLQAEARQYAELAEKYSGRGGGVDELSSAAVLPSQAAEAGSAVHATENNQAAAPPVESFPETTQDGAGVPGPELTENVGVVPQPGVAAPVSRASPPQGDAESASTGETLAHEIDLSEEWERVLAAEQGPDEPGSSLRTGFPPQDLPDERVAGAPVSPEGAEASSIPAGKASGAPSLAPIMDPALADIIEEARFYISQSMLEEARMALARAEIVSPAAPQIAELRAQLATVPVTDPQATLIEILSEVRPADAPVDVDQTMPPAAVPSPSPAEPAPATISGQVAGAGAAQQPLLIKGVEADHRGVGSSISDRQSPERPTVAAAQADKGKAAELPPAAPLDLPQPMPASDALGELVLELEHSLGEDFAGSPSAAAAPAQQPQTDGAAINKLEAGTLSPPIAPDPRISYSAAPGLLSNAAEPGAPVTLVFHPGSPQAGAPATPILNPTPPQAGGPGVPAEGGRGFSEPALMNTAELVPKEIGDESAGLNGLFTEFKRDLESSSAENDDPETHYNLGVAFKEMGLLDEAIGEFQKVCKAIESGFAFPQAIQVYTWLADCFVQNGLPEAGIHWYEKALQIPGLDGEGILAIHYELARAHEAAGDLAAARRHFMHVLSRNIDYRDVAERIKTLKS